MRGEQSARQWKILRLLERRAKGMTVQQLADELNVPTRTVYRDLDALQAARFPLYTEREGKRSYWRLVDGYRKGVAIPFTTSELTALHLSRDLLEVFTGTVFHDSIESLFSKVSVSLNPETVRYVRNLAAQVRVGFGPPKRFDEFAETVARVSDAAARRRRIRIGYRAVSTGKTTERRVDPYMVWAMNGAFYLIGHCALRNAVRTFAIDRITSVRVTDETFTVPKDFSLDDYLRTAFRVMRGRTAGVKVRFSSAAAVVVKERIWHPSQELRELPDGGLICSLQVPINYEVISWILGFGAEAEALEPPELRDVIADQISALGAVYASGRTAISKAE